MIHGIQRFTLQKVSILSVKHTSAMKDMNGFAIHVTLRVETRALLFRRALIRAGEEHVFAAKGY